MKQCFAWWTFSGHGVEDDALLNSARQIGYRGVELIGRALFDQAIDHGLEIVSQNGHGTIEDGFNNPANHDRIAREIEANLEIAARYRIPSLIVFSGSRRPDLSDEEGLEHTIAGLMRVERSARDAGVTLLLELLNSKIDHAGYQGDGAEWGCRAVDAVGSPNVKLLYDIYHAQIMEGDLIRTIEKRCASIGHYHTAGNPGRRDLDDEQEIAYPAVFRAVAATGYQGYVGHEFIPKGNPVEALNSAYNLLESALEKRQTPAE
jgi:hydroxypyruvate isomerase